MTIIRKIGPELAPKVKIVIMSATMQGPLLVRYFREVFKKVSEPLFVGFKRYPVEEIFIDEKPEGYRFAGKTHQMTGAELMALFAPPQA